MDNHQKEKLFKKLKPGTMFRFKIEEINGLPTWNFTGIVKQIENDVIYAKNIKGACGPLSASDIEERPITNWGPITIINTEPQNYKFTSKSGINMSTEIKHVKI